MAKYYIEIGQQGIARLTKSSPKDILGLVANDLQTCVGIILIGVNGNISLVHTTTEIDPMLIDNERQWVGAIKKCHIVSNLKCHIVSNLNCGGEYFEYVHHDIEALRARLQSVAPVTWSNGSSCCIEKATEAVFSGNVLNDKFNIIVTPFIENRTCANMLNTLYSPRVESFLDLQFDGEKWTNFPLLSHAVLATFYQLRAKIPNYDATSYNIRIDMAFEFLKQQLQSRQTTDESVTAVCKGVARYLSGYVEERFDNIKFIESHEKSAICAYSGNYPFVIVQDKYANNYAVCFFINSLVAERVALILSKKYKAECIEQERSTCSDNKKVYRVIVSLSLPPSEEVCWRCFKTGGLKHCAECKRAAYCSRECQRADWYSFHKREECHFWTPFSRLIPKRLKFNLRDYVSELPPDVRHKADIINYLTYEIIIRALGGEYAKSHIFSTHDKNGKDSFKASFSSPQEEHEYVIRTIQLADALYKLRHEKNIDEWLTSKEKRESDPESFVQEVVAAAVMKQLGASIKLLLEKQEGGSSKRCYDFEAEFSEQRICVEVKTKFEETSFSGKSIKSSLDKAYGQLSDENANIIVVFIPTTWANITNITQEIEAICAGYFQYGNSKVSAILVHTRILLKTIVRSTPLSGYCSPWQIYINPNAKNKIIFSIKDKMSMLKHERLPSYIRDIPSLEREFIL